MIGEREMFHYKRDIFDFFPNKSILQGFCDKINQCDADVYLVMAHKAVQLFNVLLNQNHLHADIKDKIIISSQALDYNCEYLCEKKIAIIDDIVISGTSIASTIHKLIHAGVNKNDIKIIALARDVDYQTMVFDTDDGNNILFCDALLGDAACIELSYFISQAFSFYGTPYNVDYPSYNINLEDKKEQFLFKELLWRTESTTNIDQQIGDVSAYSLFPHGSFLNKLWERIGVNLSDCAHIKIRTYVRRYLSGHSECQIVPMCLFSEISEENLNELYLHFAPTTENKTLSSVAQMRYLEFFIAHQVYLLLNEFTGLSNSVDLPQETINLLFGYDYGLKVAAFLNSSHPFTKQSFSPQAVEYIDENMLREFFSHQIGIEMAQNIAKAQHLDTTEQGNWINQIILAPFLWWYDTKEIPVRKKLKDPIRHYIRDFESINDNLARLRCGFSLNTLLYLLCGNTSNKEAETFTSIFLDHAIDQGIIVPTIFHNTSKKYLCRAYRHGEDLPFGLEDECRLAYFLQRISQKIEGINQIPTMETMDGGLSEIAFEKIIVLFYQMGMRKGGIFNHFLGFDNIRILKPFLSLHGAIQAFVDPMEMKQLGIEKTHFYSEKDSTGRKYITWLTSWAKDQCFAWNSMDRDEKPTSDVFLNGEKIAKYLCEHERSCINTTIAKRISAIADIISTWYNESIKQGKRFKEDATALTSCSNAYVFLSAISTELHYFNKFWNAQAKKALTNASSYSEIPFILNSNYHDQKNVRNIIQGLNSGRQKIGWYSKNKAQKVVDSVSCMLDGANASYWCDIWETVPFTPESTDSQARMYIDQAIALLYFFSACNDCLTYNDFWRFGEMPPYYATYKDEFCSRKNAFPGSFAVTAFDKLEALLALDDFAQKKEEFYTLVQNCLYDSNDLVRNVERLIEKKDPDYSVQYVSSLIFEVDAINPKYIEPIIMELWNRQKDLTKKSELNIIRFPNSKSKHVRYGLFYGIWNNYPSSIYKKENSYLEHGQVLLSLYQELCDLFSGQVFEIRAILIPQLPAGRRYKHNTKKNISEHAKIFSESVIEEIEHLYVSEANQQLIMVMTDSVDIELLDFVRNIGWEFLQEVSDSEWIKGFSSAKIFYNRPLPIISDNAERVFNSTVIIKCGKDEGMGLLVRTDNRVVCVTCNHEIKEYSDSIPITAYVDNQLSFQLKPIKKIQLSKQPKVLNPAEREIAILAPLWSTHIPLDVQKIISIHDLSSDFTSYTNQSCQCCSCINGNQRVWIEQIRLIGATDAGYCQAEDKQGKLKGGCSGGVLILSSDKKTIVGIHKGRIVDIATMNQDTPPDIYPHLIPNRIIKDEIMKLENMTYE